MYQVIGYGGTRAFRLLWMMEEMDLPYHHRPVMPFSDEAQQASPGGRLPALGLADGTVLLDSTAILNFLADRHQGLTAPPGSVERARQDAAIHRLLEELDAAMMRWTLIRHGFAPPPADSVREWMLHRIRRGLDGAAQALGDGDWLCGENFTIADIVLGHCLHWAERFHETITHPRLRTYMAQVERRPAYRLADSA